MDEFQSSRTRFRLTAHKISLLTTQVFFYVENINFYPRKRAGFRVDIVLTSLVVFGLHG